ncbi:Eukaryotic translation initiation factor 3 subunit B [Sphaceloma murrayae]|uniref:Eukaryotic translation initiation factor 3 subunit B n=1 Tax=Sphaceloma murrayae TaxID=2082308 RepID=A0A2K1QVA4_9PEZI|nr:Eukaryotic translation initiation factor 3 subunit B [Sphaceloma murrayae]
MDRRRSTGPPVPKRRKLEPVAELNFDPAARQEYLTGFHKRKLERAKHARELAQKKDREEKIVQRKQLRDSRKREAEQRVEEMSAFLKKQAELEDEGIVIPGDELEQQGEAQEEAEFEGFEEVPAVDALDEYVDEGKFTTVVVKELDDIRDYETEAEDGEDEDEAVEALDKDQTHDAGSVEKPKRAWTKKRPTADKSNKKKKRTFRYESKHERQTERKKQKLKNSAAAKTRKAK